MKMSMKSMVVVCFAGCAMVASGVVEFADKTQSGTRDFWDASVWRESGAPTLPRDGAAVQVASYAQDLTLSVTGDVSIAMTDLMIKCGNRQAASGAGNRLTFDGDGHVFGVPDGKATYGNPPLRFEVYRDDLAKEACFLFCEQGKDTTAGTYRWTDPVFTLEADSAYRANLTFQKGVYDFFMPNGATNEGSVVIGDTAAASNPFTVTSTVSCASGTCLKASALRVSRIGNDNASVALAFDGATLNVAETYTQCGGCVTLTNGAVATAGTTTLNGGTLLVSGPETRVETGRLWVEAGATVSLADDGRLTLGTASGPTLVGRGTGGTGVLRLLGGVFDTSGQAVSVGASGPGKIVVSGGDHRFSGGDNFIGQGCDAELQVEGGRLYMTRVRMGQGAEGTALFRQTGGRCGDGDGSARPDGHSSWVRDSALRRAAGRRRDALLAPSLSLYAGSGQRLLGVGCRRDDVSRRWRNARADPGIDGGLAVHGLPRRGADWRKGTDARQSKRLGRVHSPGSGECGWGGWRMVPERAGDCQLRRRVPRGANVPERRNVEAGHRGDAAGDGAFYRSRGLPFVGGRGDGNVPQGIDDPWRHDRA